LILANKFDLLKTVSSASAQTLAINRVKSVLERELEKRRTAQTKGINIEGLGEEGERTDMGGLECGEKEGSAFKFDEWEGGEISFLGTSTVQTEPGEKGSQESGIEALLEWLTHTM
jgi:signal recognition particle receptor subunit beta